MRYLLLLIVALLCFYQAKSQVPKAFSGFSDAVLLKDSLLTEDVKTLSIDQLPVIELTDNELKEGNAQNVSSLLNSGKEVFASAASFSFSIARFRIRGYDADFFSTYINQVPMNSLDNGYTSYSQFSGLNDVLRNTDESYGLINNSFAFGNIGSSTNIDARASKQRKQTKFSYANANKNYTHRWMLSTSTGMNAKGWAISIAGSKRYANEGYVPGTFYNASSYFMAVDKKLGYKNLLSCLVIGTRIENGKAGAAVNEMMVLDGTNYYNPYWGYQSGKKRNANVSLVNQPIIILTHELHINNNSTFVASIGYSFGLRSTTALDWYNAPDPRPDYYRYLPSFLQSDTQKILLTDAMKKDINLRQINWQKMYEVNENATESIATADGVPGNTIKGKRSRYIVENRNIYTRRFNFSSVLNKRLNDFLAISAGISFQAQVNHYYKSVNDLLGGEFYLNVNQFAERDFPDNANAAQNDLLRPNRILHKNDWFGYDYEIRLLKNTAWAQSVVHTRKVDLFFSGDLSQTKFNRVGFVKNGLFPQQSFGASPVNSFFDYGFKAGITYKINGRNYLFAHGIELTRAPFFENAYLSPRTRNTMQDSLVSELIISGEAGYVLSAPAIHLKLTGYFTTSKYGVDVLSFYHDDYNNFVNYALRNIGKTNAGIEMGLQVKLSSKFSINAVAAVGSYYYNSRQKAVITLDNSSAFLNQQTIYLKNYKLPSTPQQAYNLGFIFRPSTKCLISLSGNYFAREWFAINPVRRTSKAIEEIAPSSAQWHAIIDQPKVPDSFTLDFFSSYSWRISKLVKAKKSVYLVFFGGVNNVVNQQKIIAGGYEQLRYDFENKQVNKFPLKYNYAFGRNYFISASLRL